MPLLELQNVTKRFGGLVAVNKLSFQIEENEILGVIGPNGAGKTTIFNLISGLYPPDSGSIIFMGEDITRKRADQICKKGIARTFQLVRPFNNMTVLDNLVCGALLRTNDVNMAKREAMRISKMVGMDQKIDVKVKNLTLTERKFVEVGRALATNPKLLLIDEIAAGLNPVEVERVLKFVKEIQEKGVTICLIEHVMKAVMNLSHRIIVLNQGVKIAEGPPKEVSENELVIEAYLGEKYA